MLDDVAYRRLHKTLYYSLLALLYYRGLCAAQQVQTATKKTGLLHLGDILPLVSESI